MNIDSCVVSSPARALLRRASLRRRMEFRRAPRRDGRGHRHARGRVVEGHGTPIGRCHTVRCVPLLNREAAPARNRPIRMPSIRSARPCFLAKKPRVVAHPTFCVLAFWVVRRPGERESERKPRATGHRSVTLHPFGRAKKTPSRIPVFWRFRFGVCILPKLARPFFVFFFLKSWREFPG